MHKKNIFFIKLFLLSNVFQYRLLILKLNKKLLEKSIGGVGGGGSKLTEFGQNFVYQFSLLEAEVKEHTLKLMNKYFPEG